MVMKRTKDDLKRAKELLVPIVKRIARQKDVKARLAKGKAGRKDLDRLDFVWHELLLSFATMGNSRGAEGLIRNRKNYKRVTFEALKRKRTNAARLNELREVFCAAKVRMPDRKADWLAENYHKVAALGGPAKTKKMMLDSKGREEKIKFWRGFKGIGKKYARNIMMDVYHPDFRNYIALDERIKKITRALGLVFGGYEPEEEFYLDVAKKAGIEGWELDRMLYGFRDRVLDELEDAEDLPSVRAALKEKTIPWEHVKEELSL
jgi:thermostable 8-oxoguanine DNA glycosylase